MSEAPCPGAATHFGLRPAGPPAVDRLESAGASEIRLGPLDETAVAQVARDMLGGEPDEALRKVLSRAHGQPFLLTELLRGIAARQRHGGRQLCAATMAARLARLNWWWRQISRAACR